MLVWSEPSTLFLLNSLDKTSYTWAMHWLPIAPIPINAELPPLKSVYLHVHCNRKQINHKNIGMTEAKKRELSDNFTKLMVRTIVVWAFKFNLFHYWIIVQRQTTHTNSDQVNLK